MPSTSVLPRRRRPDHPPGAPPRRYETLRQSDALRLDPIVGRAGAGVVGLHVGDAGQRAQGAAEPALQRSRQLSGILSWKGVPHHLDIWGHDVNHDWPWWRKMLPYWLDRLL